MKSWLKWSFVFIFVVAIVFAGSAFAQEKKVVSVALRAYDSAGEFAGDLAKESILIKEDGADAEVASLRLVKNNKVEKADGAPGMEPAMNRNFILIYNIVEYNSKIADSVAFFFDKVLKKGDQLILLTPLKPYTFSQQTLQAKTTEELIEAAKTVLKRDVPVGASNYLNVVEQMKQTVSEIKMGTDGNGMSMGGTSGVDVKSLLIQYRQMLENMRQGRKVNDTLLLKFADIFKTQPGQTHLIILSHQELRPIPVRSTMSNLQKNKDLKFDAMDVFESDENKETIDCQAVSQALINSGISAHFVYLTRAENRDRRFVMKDNSQDIYNMFSKIAGLTGGIVETTSKPEAGLKLIAGFCNDYYLVDFYSPAPQADGKFRIIEIDVKDRKLKKHFQSGYLAK